MVGNLLTRNKTTGVVPKTTRDGWNHAPATQDQALLEDKIAQFVGGRALSGESGGSAWKQQVFQLSAIQGAARTAFATVSRTAILVMPYPQTRRLRRHRKAVRMSEAKHKAPRRFALSRDEARALAICALRALVRAARTRASSTARWLAKRDAGCLRCCSGLPASPKSRGADPFWITCDRSMCRHSCCRL